MPDTIKHRLRYKHCCLYCTKDITLPRTCRVTKMRSSSSNADECFSKDNIWQITLDSMNKRRAWQPVLHCYETSWMEEGIASLRMYCNKNISNSTSNQIQFVDNAALDTLTFCFRLTMSEMCLAQEVNWFVPKALFSSYTFYIELYKTWRTVREDNGFSIRKQQK